MCIIGRTHMRDIVSDRCYNTKSIEPNTDSIYQDQIYFTIFNLITRLCAQFMFMNTKFDIWDTFRFAATSTASRCAWKWDRQLSSWTWIIFMRVFMMLWIRWAHFVVTHRDVLWYVSVPASASEEVKETLWKAFRQSLLMTVCFCLIIQNK